jgi:hypothetical protein
MSRFSSHLRQWESHRSKKPNCRTDCPDLGHPQQIRLVFPELKLRGEIFTPPAIRPGNDRSSPKWSSGRNIDVLYVGNLLPQALERFWNDPLSPLWQSSYNPGFCNALADAVLDAPERSLHLSVRAAVAGLGTPPPGFDFNSQLRAVECFIRFIFRRDAVVTLARSVARMRVVAEGGTKSRCRPRSGSMQKRTTTASSVLPDKRRSASMLRPISMAPVTAYSVTRSIARFASPTRRAICVATSARITACTSTRCVIRPNSANGSRRCSHGPTRFARREHARETVLSLHTWRHRVGDILRQMQLGSGAMTGVLPPVPEP